MTSPMGWSLGDARIPEHDSPFLGRRETRPEDDPWAYPPDDFDFFAAREHGRQQGGRHRRPESVLAMRGVKLCPRCEERHFRPYPEDPSYSCHQVQCECWCTQGRS